MDAVDSAMKVENHGERIRGLHTALDQGTDSEVLYVSAIIIPRQVLSIAMQDKVCDGELTALTHELEFVVDIGADTYLSEHAATFRSVLKEVIACIHTTYSNGVPVR